jgi:glycosyltransferase involved in cell wall biosynthesis
MLNQVTPLILTYNEAQNIARTLTELHWARDIVVLDSFSDDGTIEIASTFPQVRIYQRTFDCHRNQWEFGLKETNINTPWVLALDADYIVTDGLVAELNGLQPEPNTMGYRAKFVYCVKGKRLRSGIYPAVTVLYRRTAGSYMQDGHTQKLSLTGVVEDLGSPILHDDRKSLSRWFQSQARYTELEAQKLLAAEPKTLGWTDRIRRGRVIAPPAVFLYCLIVRGGILDGWAGLYYASQRAFAEFMLSLYLIEYSLERRPQTAATTTSQQHLQIGNQQSESSN